jgi:amino acid transporter
MTPKQVFVREATGLIREFGGLDTFLINMAIINMAGGMVFDIYLIFFFPGASLPLMFFLGGIPAIGIFIVYTILSVAMPRTGGDYVYASRILHPALGFAGGIMNVFGFFVFMISGFFCWWIITNPTPAFFLAMGLTTGDPSYTAIANFISTNVNFDFILSTGLVILAGLIVALGSRVFRWTYRFVYVYYFVGAIALLIGLFATNHETFVASLDSIAGQGAYQKILSDAGSYGVYSFSWFQTLLAMVPLGFLTLSGFQVSTYLGGEVKNAKSTQALGMGASMIVTWIYLVVASYQAAAVFGNDFLLAVSYLWATSPSLLPIHAAPLITLFLSLVYRNVAFTLLICSLLVVGTFLIIPPCILAASRIVFAQSFDRVLPEVMSRVNERLHSPLNSVVVMAVLAEVWVALLYYMGLIAGFLTLQMAAPVAWGITALAAMVFPYTKRDLYERLTAYLPNWMRAKPLGVPMLSIGGTILFLGMAAWIGSMFSPIITYMYLGPTLISAVGTIVGILVFSFVWYYAVRAYRLRQGIDIALAFQELPPE